jgi:hypothetical protein
MNRLVQARGAAASCCGGKGPKRVALGRGAARALLNPSSQKGRFIALDPSRRAATIRTPRSPKHINDLNRRKRMSKSTIALLMGLTLAFAATGEVLAQAAAPAAAQPGAKLSIDSLVGDLIKDSDAKAVLTTDIPEVVSNPQLTMGYGMKLRDVAQFEPTLTAEMLGKIDKDLAAMQAKRGH